MNQHGKWEAAAIETKMKIDLKIIYFRILPILLLTIITAGAYAQKKPPIEWGVMGGANYWKLSGPSFDEKFKLGYNVGGYAQIPLGGKWGLQTGLLLNETQAKTTTQFNALYQGASFAGITLDYISLPILATYRISQPFTILAGVQYGYMIFQTEGLVQSPPQPQEAFQKNDLSILFGGELHVSKKLKFGARYVIMLTEMNNLDSNLESWKNQGLQIYIGWRLK